MKRQWAVGWHDRGLGHGDYGVIDENEKLIASVVSGLREHADLIVRAVNCHDKLLDLCKGARNALIGVTPYLPTEDPFRLLIEELTAAIAKAEGNAQ